MYYIISALTILFDVFVTFIFFDDMLKWKPINIFWKIGIGLFIFAATFVQNIFVSDMVFTILISIVTLLIAAVIGFEGKPVKKILIVIAYMILVIVSDILTTFINMIFVNGESNTLLSVAENARIMGMLMSKPIILFLVRLVPLFVNKKDFKVYRDCNVLLLTVPVISIVLLIAIVNFFDDIQISDTKPIFIVSLCVLYQTILIFYLFERIMSTASLKNKYEILEYQMVIQEEQTKSEKEIANSVKSVRHDLKNHFQALYNMLTDKHYDNAKAYIKSTGLVEDIKYGKIHTGEIAFDAIINSKLYEAEKMGIETTVNCKIPSDIEISDIDICVLFGNLLDNAIEGCMRADTDNKKISLYVEYIKSRLICRIKNTSNKTETVNGSFVSPKSDKDEHGIGIINIKSIVLKYDGICKMGYENGYFQTNMTLFV